MKSNRWITLLLIIIFNSSFAAENDSLIIAKSLFNAGEYRQAEKLLLSLHKSQPEDLNILWLYGQSAYMAKHFNTFYASYDEAIQRFPANYYLKLDYALKLVENGDVKKAEPLLESYKSYDSTSSDLLLAAAKIQYWSGNYKEALQTLNNQKLLEEKNESTLKLKNEILSAKALWTVFQASYLLDDQPLKSITPILGTGIYLNSKFSPYILWSAPVYKQQSDTKFIKELVIGNKLIFNKAGMAVNMNFGLARLTDNGLFWTYDFEISKTSFKYLQLTAAAARQPYLFTEYSVGDHLLPYHFNFNAGWNNQNTFNGKLIANVDEYDEFNNHVYNLSGWLLSPPVRFSSVQLRLGYSYAFNSSKENTFTSKSSLNDILSNYSENTFIEGYYPYYTPKNESAHSALLSVTYSPVKSLITGANLSIGLLGKTENPYLFLDNNSEGEIFINKNFQKINYYPDNFTCYILYQLTKKISIKADYCYLQNNFYTSQSVGLTIKANFWNEQKTQ